MIPTRTARALALAVSLPLAASGAAAQTQTLDTTTPSSSYGWVCCASAPFLTPPESSPNGGAFFTVAQSFLAPTGATRLLDFGFALRPNLGPGLHYRAYVLAWDAAGQHPADATPLWSSADLTEPSSPEDVRFVIDGGISLTPGQSYAAILTTLTLTGTVAQVPTTSTFNNMQVLSVDDQYAGGAMYRYASYPSQLGAGTYWSAMIAGANGGWFDYQRDARFSATFDAAPVSAAATVPEPPSVALLGLGLALAGGVASGRVRRRPA